MIYEELPDCPLHGANCLPFEGEYVRTFAELMKGEAIIDKLWIGGTFVATRLLPVPLAQDNVVKWFQTTFKGGALEGKTYQYTTFAEAKDGHNRAVIEAISAMTDEEVIADNNRIIPGVLPFPQRQEIRRILAELQGMTKARLIELLNQFEAHEGPIPFEPLNPADADNLT